MTPPAKLRIVLVEDEPLIAILLEDLLVELGHEVCATEATEAKAVSTVSRERPDLIIVDCHLREGSGIDAIAQILKVGFVPHIIMSGDNLRGVTLDRAAVILRKPFLDSELSGAIDKALATAP